MSIKDRQRLRQKQTIKLLFYFVLLVLICVGFYWWNPRDIFNKNKKINAVTNSQENNNSEAEAIEAEEKIPFSLSIPKLEIISPVNLNVDPVKENEYNQALKNGVNHLPGTALPDSGKGNIVIYGHSSSDEGGIFGQIFSSLNQLEKGDKIELSYKDQPYIFSVVDKQIVEPNNLSVLDQTKTQYITLMTCWPIGTTDERLIVIGKKVE